MSSPLGGARLKRYSRHLLIPEIGLTGQARLTQSRVLCVGLGGLGAPVVAYLAAAGVGTLGLIDDDAVDVTNLQRQVLYTQADIGRSKVEVTAERVQALNAHVTIEAFHTRLTATNAQALIAAYDLVIDCSDNFTTRYLVNDAAVLAGRANISASIYRFEAQIAVFSPMGKPCYRCLFPVPLDAAQAPSCAEGGVLGAVAGIAGSWQAAEAVKVLLGKGKSLVGRMLRIDVLNARHDHLNVPADPACELCGDHPRIQSVSAVTDDTNRMPSRPEQELAAVDFQATLAKPGVRLLDLREAHEAVLGLFPGSLHLPYSQLDERLHELDLNTTYVVACRVGLRSALAMQRLRDAGLQRLYHLPGGILGLLAFEDMLDAF